MPRNARRKLLRQVMILYFILFAFWTSLLIIGKSLFDDQVVKIIPRSLSNRKYSVMEKAQHLWEVFHALEEKVKVNLKVKIGSLEDHEVKVNSSDVKVNGTKDECIRFKEEVKGPHLFVMDVLKPFNNHDEKMLSLMTHIDVSKFPRLLQLVNHWPGPMSVSVLGTLGSLRKFVEDTINSTVILRDNIVLHLMVKTGEFYNWNLMRQMARNGVSTEYVFMVDVDLLPSKPAFDSIKKHLSSPSYKKDMALVVPAFEFISAKLVTDHPVNKSELLRLWNKGNILPFHDHWKPGYGPTDYESWRDESSAYEVKYRNMFEPYIVFNKRLAPDFDVSFILKDKVSFLYHINCVGFRFFVLPDIFVLHYPHGKDQVEHRKMLNVCAANTFGNFMKRIGNCSEEKINLRIT